MATYYRVRFGARWPDDGSGGGFGHAGFYRLSPSMWNIPALLSSTVTPKFQPRVGGSKTTALVPPSVVPCFCFVYYSYNADTGVVGFGTGGTSSLTYRVWVTPPGGSELLVLSAGNPARFYWNTGLTPNQWSYVYPDTTHPYYLASPGVIPAGWSNSLGSYTANCVDPEGLGSQIYSDFRELLKTTAWDVGTWTIRFWAHTDQNCASGVWLDPDVSPEHWTDESSWSFTVGGYEPLSAETGYEAVKGYIKPLDFFTQQRHWRKHD